MALNCQLSISPPSYSAGGTPVPALSLLCVNPNGFAVSVTGVDLLYFDNQGNTIKPAINSPIVPIGPGMGAAIAANSSQTFGPMGLAAYSAANSNTFSMVPPQGLPANPQASQQSQAEIYIGALVYASDGSANVAGRCRLLLSYAPAPPRGFQGGNADHGLASNACMMGALV